MESHHLGILLVMILFLASCDVRPGMRKVGQETKKFVKALLLVDETSPECPAKITFDNYPGFRDWYRFSLHYPYHLIMIDTFDSGALEKYLGGDIRDPNVSSEHIVSGIVAIIKRKDALIFRSMSPDRRDIFRYGIFHYATGKLEWFSDEPALKNFLKQSGKLEFDSLEKSYNEFIRCQNKR